MKKKHFSHMLFIYFIISFIGFAIMSQNDLRDLSTSDASINGPLPLKYCFWEPQIIRSVGNEPYSVFIGDANNDGQNDIIAANRGSNNISILLWNTTSGDWDEQITRTVGDTPRSVFVGDVNNDSQKDIVTANFNGDNVSILLWNSTAGDWDDQITRPVGNGPRSVYIGDANNDGQNDIVTAGDVDGNVSILLWNTTSGDWDDQIIRPVGNLPTSVFIEDADNDGQNDIVVANYWSDNIMILCWNTTLGNWSTKIIENIYYPCSLFVGDANNDGQKDIVAAADTPDQVSILLWNTTSSDWGNKILKSVGNGPEGVFIGDANNDGQNDIVTANSNSDDVAIILWNPVPVSPFLDPILPRIDVGGRADLSWSNVSEATAYYIYRDISNITSAVGLTPIAKVLDNNYSDNTIMNNIVYFYVIVAENVFGNSSISNCESVLVRYLPGAPVLYPILPNPDNDGIIYLNWTDVGGATNYYIYRDISNITSVVALTPIATVSESNYTDTVMEYGNHYYVIVAGNSTINGSISNCESVFVRYLPGAPLLYPILPNPDDDGIIYLNWTDVGGATIYYVYRDISNITSVVALTPIATVSESKYTDTVLVPGIYYYVIVAGNSTMNGSISNCEKITFKYWRLTGTLIDIDDTVDSKNWSRTAEDNPWCNGNGTIDEPYVIENVTINAQNSGSCISINNSKVYFIIQNCILYNSSIGIKIINAANVKIINVTIVNLKGINGINRDPSATQDTGGNGNESIGIAIYDSINVNISLNQISNISGGNGGWGSEGLMAFPEGNGYDGGNGGNGNNAYAIYLDNSSDIAISHNNISSIKGGDGGMGGTGGHGIDSGGGYGGN
ncbi:MAG: VCBS repeat-containing protein, partial [Candidatus Helarchaeota archaeon]|nr:VCBS repeat-containing protein [Candidatus Helarchaeota archaeon]